VDFHPVVSCFQIFVGDKELLFVYAVEAIEKKRSTKYKDVDMPTPIIAI
jgi:hypothetical protein